MQHIAKGDGPQSLDVWVQAQRNAKLTPLYRALQNPEKKDCKNELIREQGAVCCYCNRAISDASVHIEHLEARKHRPDLQVAWTNLLGCCAQQNLKGRKLQTQHHCGEFRGSAAVGISPLDRQCAANFSYSYAGSVEPEPGDNNAAILAIKNLNLNAERLIRARKAHLEEAYDDIEKLDEATWVDVYLEWHEGNSPEFAAMLLWFYEHGWREELSVLAPNQPTK